LGFQDLKCLLMPKRVRHDNKIRIETLYVNHDELKIMSKLPIILSIDTSDSTQTTIRIIRAGAEKKYEEATSENKSQNVLPLMMQALKQEKLTLGEITEIKVNPGPGSFTGVRVGVTVANTLGWVLGIPVNGKKIELPKYAESKYD